MSWGSVVSIVSRLQAGKSGFQIPAGQEIFLFCEMSRMVVRPSVSYAVGIGVLLQG